MNYAFGQRKRKKYSAATIAMARDGDSIHQYHLLHDKRRECHAAVYFYIENYVHTRKSKIVK